MMPSFFKDFYDFFVREKSTSTLEFFSEYTKQHFSVNVMQIVPSELSYRENTGRRLQAFCYAHLRSIFCNLRESIKCAIETSCKSLNHITVMYLVWLLAISQYIY